MSKLFFITIITLLQLSCHNHDTKRSNIFHLSKDELIKQIANENIVAGSAVGIGGIEPDQWVRFLALKSKTNKQELVSLTNHYNSAVKCYAFIALIEKKSKDVFPLVLTNISDTNKVQTLYGCILNTLTIADFFVDEIYSDELIDKKHKQILDSIIIFGENKNLILKDVILDSISPIPSYYRLIKARVNQDFKYLIPLSKYRNSQDVEVILHFLNSADSSVQYWGLRAIINFPDKSFFPRLVELAKENYISSTEQKRNYLDALYKALVQYKNQSSKNILIETIQKSTGVDSLRKVDLVYDALRNYPDSVYKNLIQYF